MDKKRIEWVDIAKGIAIISVVIGHVVSSYHETGMYLNNMWWSFVHQFVYSFHMPLFMLLSGMLYGLSTSKGDKSKQIKRKLLNYGIPYIFFSALWVIMKISLSSLINSEVGLNDLLVIGIYPISFMWYLYALLIITVVQILINNIIQKPLFKTAYVIFVVGGYLIQPHIATLFETINFSDCVINDVLKMHIYFLIGLYGTTLLLRKDNRRSILLIASAIMILGNTTLFLTKLPLGQTCSRIVDFIIAISGILTVIEISKILSTKSFHIRNVLEMIGRNSLPIYCCLAH